MYNKYSNLTEIHRQHTATIKFLAAQGTHLRFSCPYTSPQNGKDERIIRTLNNSVRTMLLHASLPPTIGPRGS
jgi:hypothetical protein